MVTVTCNEVELTLDIHTQEAIFITQNVSEI